MERDRVERWGNDKEKLKEKLREKFKSVKRCHQLTNPRAS